MASGQRIVPQSGYYVLGLGHSRVSTKLLSNAIISSVLPEYVLQVSIADLEVAAYQESTDGSYDAWVVRQVVWQLEKSQINKNQVAAIALEANLGRAGDEIAVDILCKIVGELQTIFQGTGVAVSTEDARLKPELLRAVESYKVPVILFSGTSPTGNLQSLPKYVCYIPKNDVTPSAVKSAIEGMQNPHGAGSLLSARLSRIKRFYESVSRPIALAEDKSALDAPVPRGNGRRNSSPTSPARAHPTPALSRTARTESLSSQRPPNKSLAVEPSEVGRRGDVSPMRATGHLYLQSKDEAQSGNGCCAVFCNCLTGLFRRRGANSKQVHSSSSLPETPKTPGRMNLVDSGQVLVPEIPPSTKNPWGEPVP